MLDYFDFAIRIDSDGRGGFESRVISAPGGGSASAPFEPPFDLSELSAQMDGLGEVVRGREAARHLEGVAVPAAPLDPREVGAELFKALFRGAVRNAFFAAMGSFFAGSGRGMRLRLLIDPDSPGCRAIAALPWELLYDPHYRTFFSTRIRTPVVRSLPVNAAPKRVELDGPIRVLVALASPEGLPPIDLAAERAAAESWGRRRRVEIVVLERASFDEVKRRLDEEDFHVFHFTGHGEFGSRDGRGRLLFEAAQGQAEAVDAARLDAILDDKPTLQLAVLNACESGAFTRRDGLDPYAGVATALVRSGVPAVVAMQFPITDRAAVRFCDDFYRALAAGLPVDAAVSRGRRGIIGEGLPGHEWATPVLHLRLVEGRLFARRNDGWKRWRRWLAAAGLGLAALATVAAVWPGLGGEPEEARTGRPPYHRPAPVENDRRCPAPELLQELELVYLQPGSLPIPSGKGDPPRLLKLERGLCAARYEVDRRQWAMVMGLPLPPEDEQDLPAADISVAEAQVFLSRLNGSDTGEPFRLPTGEEWEYAARGRAKTRYSFGDDPGELPLYGNCQSSGEINDYYDNDPAPVGSYPPNAFGLYDVHGNVAEWVTDTQENEQGELRRIRRGGSYRNVAESCELEYRPDVGAERSDRETGFRVVRDPVEPES